MLKMAHPRGETQKSHDPKNSFDENEDRRKWGKITSNHFRDLFSEAGVEEHERTYRLWMIVKK